MRSLVLTLLVPVALALTFKVWWLQGDQPFVAYKPWITQNTTVCSNATVGVTITAYLKGIGTVKLFDGQVSGCRNVTLKSLGPLALLAQYIKMDVKAGGVLIRDFEYMRATTGDLCVKYKLLVLPPLTPGEGVLLVAKNVCPFPVKMRAVVDPFGLDLFDVVLKPNKSYMLSFSMPKIYDSLLKDVYFEIEVNGTKSVVLSVPAFNYVLSYLVPYSKVVWFSQGKAVAKPEGWSEACVTLPSVRPYFTMVPVKVTYEVYQSVYASSPKLVAKTTFVARNINDFERCVKFYARTGFPVMGYYVVAKVGNVEWRVKG